ncbi:hypothetical protein D018_1316A, partial [Vibrio parahaemolyticus VP2007-007]|jgi:hypothetical protein
MSGKF